MDKDLVRACPGSAQGRGSALVYGEEWEISTEISLQPVYERHAKKAE